jgi:hypothetical protein
MSISKLTVPNRKNYYKNASSIRNVFHYILRTNPRKPYDIPVRYYGGINLDPEDVEYSAELIKRVQKFYNKASGRRMYHYFLSFDIKVNDPYSLSSLGYAIANEFFSDCQMLYAVHEDTDNLHLHIAFSSVKVSGEKWHKSSSEFRSFKAAVEKYADEFLFPKEYSRVYSFPHNRRVNLEDLIAPEIDNR